MSTESDTKPKDDATSDILATERNADATKDIVVTDGNVANDLIDTMTESARTNLDTTTTILCGYLYKLSKNPTIRSHNHGFKKRWFVFSPSDCKLNYYRAKGDLISKGDIDIRRASFGINPVDGHSQTSFGSSPQSSSGEESMTFTINTPDKAYTLKGTESKVTLFWLSELQRLRKEYIMNLAKGFGVDLKPHHVLGHGGSDGDVQVVEVGSTSSQSPNESKRQLDRRGTNVSLSTFYINDPDPDPDLDSSRRTSISGTSSSMTTSVSSSKPPTQSGHPIHTHAQSGDSNHTHAQSGDSNHMHAQLRESRSQDSSKRKSVGFGSRVMAGIRSRAESMTRGSERSRLDECKRCGELDCKLIALRDEHEAVLNEFQASREVIHLLQRQLDSSHKETQAIKDLLTRTTLSEDLVSRLSFLESKLIDSESNLLDLRNTLTRLTSDHQLLKRSHDESVNQVSILCDTIQAKDKTICTLTNELYDRDGCQSSNGLSIDYQASMDKLSDSVTAYRIQNDFLNKEIVELNYLRNLSEKKAGEMRLRSAEWEARCCQIQSKLLSLLKEINASIEQRDRRLESPSSHISSFSGKNSKSEGRDSKSEGRDSKSEGENSKSEGKDGKDDTTASSVTLSEATVNLVTRLLEDISIDIPLSWKRGNRSRNEDPTINLASRVSSDYDDLGFSNKANRVLHTEESTSSLYLQLSASDLDTSGEVKSQSAVSGATQSVVPSTESTQSSTHHWKSRWDAYVGGLGSSQELVRTSELKHLLRSGIPREYRCKIWKGLIHMRVKNQRESAGSDYYQSLLNGKSGNISPSHSVGSSMNEASGPSTVTPSTGQTMTVASRLIYDPIIKQIELDLLRTLPDNKHFESLESDGTCRLRRVLIAYSRHNPDVGYCQGLNRLAAVSLLFMPEEDAFWSLVTVIEYLMPPDYYNSNLLGAHVDQHVFRDLLAEKMPALSNHLSSFGIEITLFSWFLTCFIDNIPVHVYLRIWDVFLYEGNKILFRFALAFLKLHENELLSSNDSLTINTLLRTIGQRSINVQQLSRIAFSLLNPFPMSKVRTKRTHYTLLVKSELDKLENMRKTLPRKKYRSGTMEDHDDEE